MKYIKIIYKNNIISKNKLKDLIYNKKIYTTI